MSDSAPRLGVLRSSLARRLIVGIILVSSAITLCLTSVQLYSEYRHELGGIENVLRQIEDVHLKSLSQSLWATNANDMRLQLEGMVRVPNIEYAAVHEGEKLWAEAGHNVSGNVIKRQYRMTYTHGDRPIDIGTLTVVAGLDLVYRQLLTQALVILASNAFKTFLVAAFAFVFFHWLVNRRLLAISAYLRGLDVRRPPALILARPAGAPPDEIDDLAAAINLTRENARAAVAALRESNARLRLTAEAANIGLWERDLRTHKIHLSPEYLRHIGYGPDELPGSSDDWESRLHPEDRDRALAVVRDYVEGRSDTYESEYRLRHKDGAYRWFLSRGSVLRDESGQPIRLLGVLIEITARKRAEEARRRLEAQLRQAQKMEALGTLAGGIAHDFNNILGAMIGNVELARQDVGTDHAAQKSLAEVAKASARARDLVRQILTFSRQQAHERRVIALREVAEESVKLLRASLPAGIELVTAFAADTPNVLADRTQIHQVLMNLCANAWHAMEGKAGRIDVVLAGVTADGSTTPGNLRPGRYARLTVTDTGKGMDAATVERIFDPFFTTKSLGEGTGLGLAVVDGIVKNHEGVIVVYSEPGRGSVFHVYFPAVESGVEPLPKAPSSLPRGSGQRILYVDDEEALVSLAAELLGRLGYVVKGFTRAAEALAAFQADPDAFDLLVTDLNMPGASGLEVASEIRRLRPEMPMALTSGYVTEELRVKARALGIREIIYKPNTADDLIEVLHRMLAKHVPPE